MPHWLLGAAVGLHATVTAHAEGKVCCPLAANLGVVASTLLQLQSTPA